jgi:hypothetical protein
MNPIDFHYNALSAFNEDYYSGLLTQNHLIEEIAIGPKEEAEMFWVLKKGKKKYLLTQDMIDYLPLKIRDTVVESNRGKVYHVLLNPLSVKFKSEKKLTFRELVDSIAPFDHSHPDNFLLFKLIAITSFVDRINVRISTPASFGKDSVFRILQHLRNNVAVITPKSSAAIEYRLHGNSILTLNELSNLGSEQKHLVQQFLLLTGDFGNVYEKPTRGTQGYNTYDTYDISKLSIVILYNTIDYYRKVKQEERFFDRMFTRAVMDRFVPIKFDGTLDVNQFSGTHNFNEIAKNNREKYIDIIHTLEFFSNEFSELNHGWNEDSVDYSSLEGRHPISFEKIVKSIGLYSKTQEEFGKLVKLLHRSIKDYEDMVYGTEREGDFVYKKGTNNQSTFFIREETIGEGNAENNMSRCPRCGTFQKGEKNPGDKCDNCEATVYIGFGKRLMWSKPDVL